MRLGRLSTDFPRSRRTRSRSAASPGSPWPRLVEVVLEAKMLGIKVDGMLEVGDIQGAVIDAADLHEMPPLIALCGSASVPDRLGI